MFQWLKKLFKKKNNDCCDVEIKTYSCESCVWWKAEEENNVAAPSDDRFRFCDAYKDYTHENHTCALHIEERFEASADSIQTEELEINHNLEIEESESIDPSREKK